MLTLMHAGHTSDPYVVSTDI